MTIQARYPGTCCKCGGKINVGDAINWDKDTRQTRHVACPAKAAAPASKPAAPVAEPLAVERLAARYAGTCGGCGGAIHQGDQIEYHRAERAAYHLGCAGKAQEPAPVTVVFTGRHKDSGPVSGHTFRNKGGQILTVVRVTARYVRQDDVDDEDDFRGGGDPFWEFAARCRAATDAEAGPILAREVGAEQQRQAVARLDAVRRQVQEQGERPEGQHVLGSERLCDSQTIYGGGDWFVIEDDAIWYIRNNGGDGDNWSTNNVRTGGAGAIGWRIPLDADLAAELRTLEPIVKAARKGVR